MIKTMFGGATGAERKTGATRTASPSQAAATLARRIGLRRSPGTRKWPRWQDEGSAGGAAQAGPTGQECFLAVLDHGQGGGDFAKPDHARCAEGQMLVAVNLGGAIGHRIAEMKLGDEVAGGRDGR